MKLALGPLAYYWPEQVMRDFYRQVESWPVDIVYLGEVVCAKRRNFGLDDWLETADRLSATGKEIVLSTLALVEAASELNALERICRNGRYRVEANDMAAVQVLSSEAAFVVGPHLNCYNPATLGLLAGMGATRWVAPVEMSASMLNAIQLSDFEGVETEVLAYGRLPLAFSARCFTARDAGIPKDHCEFRCEKHPDGLRLSTQENQPLFTVNGVQLQSGLPCNLLDYLDTLRDSGVDVLRLMPQMDGMAQIVEVFHQAIYGHVGTTATLELFETLNPDGYCNGYWHGNEGMHWYPPTLRSE